VKTRDIETEPGYAHTNPGCRFTHDGRAIFNYCVCEHLDGYMQDLFDLRVALIDTPWFYGE